MLKKIFLNNYFIAFLIVLNAVVLFLDSFQTIQTKYPWLDKLDLIVNVLFYIEMIIKIRYFSWKNYIKDGWNKLDFSINILLFPSFLILFFDYPDIFFLTVVRLIRITKFFRFFKFVPNINHLMNGISRALKASVFIFIALSIYLFIVSILSCFFFKGVCPEHFGDPIKSLYSTFKIFTIEGWYDLPELISDRYGEVPAFFVKMYFIFLVLTGGVFGMSLVNAIFVDEMVSDNNDEVLEEIKKLRSELHSFTKNRDDT